MPWHAVGVTEHPRQDQKGLCHSIVPTLDLVTAGHDVLLCFSL